MNACWSDSARSPVKFIAMHLIGKEAWWDAFVVQLIDEIQVYLSVEYKSIQQWCSMMTNWNLRFELPKFSQKIKN